MKIIVISSGHLVRVFAIAGLLQFIFCANATELRTSLNCPIIVEAPISVEVTRESTREGIEFSAGLVLSEEPVSYLWYFKEFVISNLTMPSARFWYAEWHQVPTACGEDPSTQCQGASTNTIGIYMRLAASNSSGVTFSRPFVARYPGSPVIDAHPTAQNIREGESAFFTVSAQPANSKYQWHRVVPRFSGELEGETNSFLIIPYNRATNGATFYVTVSNELGTVTSIPAVLRTEALPPKLEFALVAGLWVSGTIGSRFTIEYRDANSLVWTPIEVISLTEEKVFWADPRPLQSRLRLYRAVQKDLQGKIER